MKPFICFIAGLLAISTLANSQESKLHLRDFTPTYTVDTFPVKGDEHFVKRRVIALQQTEGIKVAYWDDASTILTVQYNTRLVQLSAIKNFFSNNQPLTLNSENQKQGNKPAFLYGIVSAFSKPSKSKQ